MEFPYGKDFVDIFLITLIFKWVVEKKKAGEPLFVKNPINLPLFAYIAWAFVEYLYGAAFLDLPIVISNADPRFMAFKNLLILPLLFFIVVNNIKEPTHVKLIVLLIILSVLAIDRNFYNTMRFRDHSHYSYDLEIGVAPQALTGNSLAVFLAQYTIIFVALFLCMRNVWLKLFLTLPIGLGHYVIMFMFSRSGYLATLVGWTFIGVVKNRRLLGLIIILFLSWQVLLPTAVKERISMTKSDDGYDATTQQRLGMWSTAIELISSNPILGAGFEFAQAASITVEDFGSRTWHSFHNAYLQTAVEFGLVGLAIFLWMFFTAFRVGWRLYRISEENFHKALGLGLSACVLACMAGNFAGTYWHYQNVMAFYWILLAIGLRCQMIIEGQYQPENKDSTVNNFITKLFE